MEHWNVFIPLKEEQFIIDNSLADYSRWWIILCRKGSQMGIIRTDKIKAFDVYVYKKIHKHHSYYSHIDKNWWQFFWD